MVKKPSARKVKETAVRLNRAVISTNGKINVFINEIEPKTKQKSDNWTKFFRGISLFNFFSKLVDVFV